MDWLNPWAWLGGLSVALPVLVHLYSRRPPREAPFPSLRFLEASRLLPTRRTRISDLPLLLVRVAILVMAVAALAQPAWQSVRSASSNAVARAVVVDTLAGAGSPADRSALEQTVTSQLGESAASLRVNTDAPHAALSGATEWLQRQPGRRELIVLSGFRNDAIDSLDIAQIPKDVTVRLVRTPSGENPAAAATSRTSGRVQWSSGGAPALVDAVQRAARTTGAHAVDTTGGNLIDPLAHTVRVVSPGADSTAAWIGRARKLDQPWMGDVVSALRRDTVLVTAAWAAPATDTMVAPPFTVLHRNATQAPLIAVAALPNANGGSQLLLLSRAPADALATVTLLWSASRALDPIAVPVGVFVTDAQLRQWERAPSAQPRTDRVQAEREDSQSLGRFLWIGALLLLGVETYMRRRLSMTPSPSAA